VVAKPAPSSIPESPGSYQFKDAQGRVIYVGKASNLRSRVSQYFQDARHLHPRTVAMVNTATSVEWIEVRNEVEALMLEYNLIKQHRPRFNVRLRDDKSYPFLAVTVDEPWPRAVVMRGTKRKGTRYFGPYAHAYAIRDTLDLLLRTFPVRTCSPGKFNQHSKLGRPCLLFHIEKCSGPCVGEVEKSAYDVMVRGLCEFLEGDVDAVVSELELKMKRASEDQEYEVAGRTRDRLHAVRRASEKQLMVGERDEDFDVIAVADDELEASVQVFFVRKGRVLGRKGYILDKVEDLTAAGVIGRTIENLYGDPPPLGVPKFLLVPELPADAAVYEEWLRSLRGTRVDIRVPQKGDKRELLETVSRNASEEFLRHRLRRASDHNARSRALTELQDSLGLPEAPLRIECYDMAHLQGQDYVGSMVVMEDGLPVKREYRKFKVRAVEGNDDYAAMGEVLRRRLEAYITERDTPREDGSKPGKFAYPPQLILVDGGKGQLGVAVQVIAELGLEDEIPVASLAKRYEEVFVPGRPEPVRIGRGSDALFMLQRIRDEAHRFANTFHRDVRGKRMLTSELDGIPGLGKTRANRLLAELGDINAVKSATPERLAALTWLPRKVAESIFVHFHPQVQSEEGQD